MIRQRYDLTADALYITVTDAPVARTVEIDEGTLADIDEIGALVGIEVITPQRAWDLEQILGQFKVSTTDGAELRAYFAGHRPAELTAPAHPALVAVTV